MKDERIFIVVSSEENNYEYIDVIKATDISHAVKIFTDKHGLRYCKTYIKENIPPKIWIIVSKYVNKEQEISLNVDQIRDIKHKRFHSLY